MEKPKPNLKAEHPPPPLPAIAQRLLELVRIEAPLETLAQTLATDASMATRALRLANSVALRGATPITTLHDAFLRIGTDQLRQLILGLIFIHNFPRRGAFDYRAFWKHSLHVALASQILERLSPQRTYPSSDAYTAGLLHDIGIPCLVFSASTRYRELIAAARATSAPLTAIEQEHLGIDHQHAAAQLLAEWRFSAPIIAAAQYHSLPRNAAAEHRHLVLIVHAADRIVWSLGIDNGVKRVSAEFDDTVLRALSIEPEAYTMICDELRMRGAEIEGWLE